MNASTPNPSVESPVAPPKFPEPLPRFPFLLLITVWLTVVLMTTLVTMVLPQSFASSARIMVEPDHADVPSLADSSAGPPAYDPYYLQTQFEIIQSELILNRVIERLDLNTEWGRRYADGAKLKTTETVAMLRARLDLRPVSNTSLIDIRVYSENPTDAAKLANAIAEAYKQWRLDQFRSSATSGLKALAEKLAEVEARIQHDTKHLAETATPSETVSPLDARYQPYFEQKRKLDELIDFRHLLQRRLEVGGADVHLPRAKQVMIVETAHPPIRPVRPNVPLNITLSILLGGFVSVFLALLVYLLSRYRYRRQSGAGGAMGWRGVRTALRITIALVVGGIVGYNCAMPVSPASLLVTQFLVLLGGAAIAYVELAKPSPLSPPAAAPPGTPPSGPPSPDGKL